MKGCEGEGGGGGEIDEKDIRLHWHDPSVWQINDIEENAFLIRGATKESFY